MKYRVPLVSRAFATVTVEADSEDEAIDAAFNGELPWLCGQCTGWGQDWSLELTDWEGDDDAEVTPA